MTRSRSESRPTGRDDRGEDRGSDDRSERAGRGPAAFDPEETVDRPAPAAPA